MVRRRLGGLAVVGSLALLGCRASTVSFAFAPAEGDRYEYRYELTATITRQLDGDDPEVIEIDEELAVEQEVLEQTDEGTRVEVEVARAGGSRRTAVVLLDRAGSLRGIQLVEGLEAEVFGLADGDALLPPAVDVTPDEPLSPGDRWSMGEGERRGHGRLLRLGIVDGEDVAVVRTSTTETLEEEVTTGTSVTDLTGRLRSRATTTYDLVDGAIRRSHGWSRGELVARIRPPAGLAADPVDATITYDISVRVHRTG